MAPLRTKLKFVTPDGTKGTISYDPKPILRTNIRGKRYAIHDNLKSHNGGPFLGICSSPALPNRVIAIAPQTGREMLTTLIHEALHACFFDLKEEAITDAGESIANLLWKTGFRYDE